MPIVAVPLSNLIRFENEHGCSFARQLNETSIWPVDRRIRLEVLAHNQGGMAFWGAIGFQEYAITFELDRHDRVMD